MDRGEAGVTSEPAQEHVEEASKQPSENVTDQSESMSLPMAAISDAARWTSTQKELFNWGLRKSKWVDFQGCETLGILSTFIHSVLSLSGSAAIYYICLPNNWYFCIGHS